jgi:hypothetical protein
MDLGIGTIQTKGCEFLLDDFEFVGRNRCKRIPISRSVFKLIKCIIYSYIPGMRR